MREREREREREGGVYRKEAKYIGAKKRGGGGGGILCHMLQSKFCVEKVYTSKFYSLHKHFCSLYNV